MWICPETSLLMTRPRALSDLLMAEASFSCCPSESAAFCRSLPACALSPLVELTYQARARTPKLLLCAY